MEHIQQSEQDVPHVPLLSSSADMARALPSDGFQAALAAARGGGVSATGQSEVGELKAAIKWLEEALILNRETKDFLEHQADKGNEHAARLLAVLEEED